MDKIKIVIDGLSDKECELIANIIYSALVDYNREIPAITKDMTYDRKMDIRRMVKDKASAKWFFQKSRLFKLTSLSFEYLQDAYLKGRIKNG